MDRHAMYEIAVQQPLVMVGFIQELFARFGDRFPLVLREDFCGTAKLAATWVASHPDRRAVGVDRDGAVLRWADAHNRTPLGPAARRLVLIESDVLRCRRTADAIASLNFSHFIWHDRPSLVAYFRHVRRCLRPGGLFVADCYGGPGTMVPCREQRNFGAFAYTWEQASFDPLTNRVVNYIHFTLRPRPRNKSGRTIRRAFTYDWRLWSIAELREAMNEAGLEPIGVWYESEDGFVESLDAAEHEAWVAYLAARGC